MSETSHPGADAPRIPSEVQVNQVLQPTQAQSPAQKEICARSEVKKAAVFLPACLMVLLTYVLGTSEYIVFGSLPEIAERFGVSVTLVGSLAAFYAIAYAVGTPVISGFTARFKTMRLLGVLLCAFILVHLLSAVAWNIELLFVLRILTALVNGPLIALDVLLAKRIIPKHATAKVIAWIFTGFSIANLAGMPLTSWLTVRLGLGASFIFVAALGALCLISFSFLMPRFESGVQTEREIQVDFEANPTEAQAFESKDIATRSEQSERTTSEDSARGDSQATHYSWSEQLQMFKDVRILLLFSIATTALIAPYIVYTYFTTLLKDVYHLTAEQVSLCLFAYGIFTIISSLSSGYIAERKPLRIFPIVFVVQIILFLAFGLLIHQMMIALILFYVLTVTMCMHFTGYVETSLGIVMREYPAAQQLSSGLLSVGTNVGIALGALIGGQVVASAGLETLPFVAAIVVFIPLASAILAYIKLGAQTKAKN